MSVTPGCGANALDQNICAELQSAVAMIATAFGVLDLDESTPAPDKSHTPCSWDFA
jgi:hypothetical protein